MYDRPTDGYTNEQTEGQTHGWTNRWTDGIIVYKNETIKIAKTKHIFYKQWSAL